MRLTNGSTQGDVKGTTSRLGTRCVLLWPRVVAEVVSGWLQGVLDTGLVASDRGFLFNVGDLRRIPALIRTPRRWFAQPRRRREAGVGQAAQRYSWMSPPSTSTRSIRRMPSIPPNVGAAGGTGTSRSMPRCGRATL